MDAEAIENFHATLFIQSRTVETGKVYLLHILCKTANFWKSHVSSDVIPAASEPIKFFSPTDRGRLDKFR